MPVKRLKEHRACREFKQRVIGAINVLELLEAALADGQKEYSSNDLMYIHFNHTKTAMDNFLSNPTRVANFRRLYPNEADELLEAAQSISDEFETLHTVRTEILMPYARPDGKDIVRDSPLAPNLRDRAAMLGLTEAQQAAFEATLDKRGFMKLTMVERNRLRNAIRQALADD